VQHLFAPWRFAYVSHAEETTGCIFCAAAAGGAATHTVFRGERCFALLNRYPYTSGHTMVAPYAHVAEFEALSPAELAEMMELAQRIVRALGKIYQPHAFNLGLNLGEAAGAGIADNLHLHIVPRWRGDTSFMSTSGRARVIPEDLDSTWGKLQAALEGEDAIERT
jgi:ATP adenylyltransferase